MICERWDVVAVPFPFSERPGVKRRPALVVSNRRFNGAGHCVMCMITTRSEPGWPTDHPIADLTAAGLPAPSIARLKLFTLDTRLVEKRLGSLAEADRRAVGIHLQAVLAD